MPRWEDPRGPHHGSDRDRWRTAQPGERGSGSEARSFEAGREAAGNRRAALYDQDRAGYGGETDAGEAGYARRRGVREDTARCGDDEPSAYGGQEYGVEGPGAGRGPGWGFEPDDARRRNFDVEDPGSGQSQAGYAAAARSPHAHDFDPDYVRWREAQLRDHDREYEEWRLERRRQYDEQYRQSRGQTRRR